MNSYILAFELLNALDDNGIVFHLIFDSLLKFRRDFLVGLLCQLILCVRIRSLCGQDDLEFVLLAALFNFVIQVLLLDFSDAVDFRSRCCCCLGVRSCADGCHHLFEHFFEAIEAFFNVVWAQLVFLHVVSGCADTPPDLLMDEVGRFND